MGSDGVVRISLCVVLAVIGVTAVGAYAFAVALAPLFGLTLGVHARGLRTDPGPDATWAEVTPNLGWLLLGSVFAAVAPQRRPDRHDPARRRRHREGAGHPVRLRRAARAHPAVHVPGGAGSAPAPPVAGSPRRGELGEFRNGLKRLLVDGPRRRRRRHRRRAAARPVRARGRASAPTTSPAARWPCSPSAAPATWSPWRSPRRSSPSRATPSSPLGWFIGVVAFLLGTWLSSDDLFRRVEIGLLLSSVASMAAFAVALRYRSPIGAIPDSRLDDGRHHRHAAGVVSRSAVR